MYAIFSIITSPATHLRTLSLQHIHNLIFPVRVTGHFAKYNTIFPLQCTLSIQKIILDITHSAEGFHLTEIGWPSIGMTIDGGEMKCNKVEIIGRIYSKGIHMHRQEQHLLEQQNELVFLGKHLPHLQDHRHDMNRDPFWLRAS